jgi:hypothetical protein
LRSLFAVLRQLTLPAGAGPNDPAMVLGLSGSAVPAELVTAYGFFGFTIITANLYRKDSNDYDYDALLLNGGGTQTIWTHGSVVAGVVTDIYGQASAIAGGLILGSFSGSDLHIGTAFVGGSTVQVHSGCEIRILAGGTIELDGLQQVNSGAEVSVESGGLLEVESGGVVDFLSGSDVDFSGLAEVKSGGEIEFESGSTLDVQVGAAMTVDAISHGRGFREWTISTANTAAIGAEAVVLTGSSFTWAAERAYSVEFVHQTRPSAAGNYAFFQIRRTNLAGAVKQTWYEELATIADKTVCKSTVLRNNTASDISDNIVLTMGASAGTMTGIGAATTPRLMHVRDIGAADDYPTAVQI